MLIDDSDTNLKDFYVIFKLYLLLSRSIVLKLINRLRSAIMQVHENIDQVSAPTYFKAVTKV